MTAPINKQVEKSIHSMRVAYIGIDGLTLAADGGSIDVTAGLTTALNTAGRGAKSVPLQVSTDDDTQGLKVGATRRLEIFDDESKTAVQVNGNEVYGILSEAGGVYTITFKSLVNGVETDTDLKAGDYDIVLPYMFNFETIPVDTRNIATKYVGQDPSGAGRTVKEAITIATLNTIPDLANLPIAGTVELNVTGKELFEGTANPAFTVAAKVVTWDQSKAWDIEPGESVYAVYQTNE